MVCTCLHHATIWRSHAFHPFSKKQRYGNDCVALSTSASHCLHMASATNMKFFMRSETQKKRFQKNKSKKTWRTLGQISQAKQPSVWSGSKHVHFLWQTCQVHNTGEATGEFLRQNGKELSPSLNQIADRINTVKMHEFRKLSRWQTPKWNDNFFGIKKAFKSRRPHSFSRNPTRTAWGYWTMPALTSPISLSRLRCLTDGTRGVDIGKGEIDNI